MCYKCLLSYSKIMPLSLQTPLDVVKSLKDKFINICMAVCYCKSFPVCPYVMLSANNDDIPLILFVMCQSFVTFARLFLGTSDKQNIYVQNEDMWRITP